MLAICLIATLAACRREVAVIPARVVSGSMAPHLVGEHWEVTCGDCGKIFQCGVEHPPDGMLAVCPDCGYAENKIDENARRPGTAVNVVPRDFSAAPPRRWEVIAFDEPGSDHVVVKRVVGLPGERVAIRGGDVFVDGRRVQKSPEEFTEIGQPLYNPAFFPKVTEDFPARWQPDGDGSQWRDAFAEEERVLYQCPRAPLGTEDFDWLKYHHISGAATGAPRMAAARILDNYGYNQGLARGLNAVGDVMLVFGLTISDGGEFCVRLWEGDEPLTVTLAPRENVVTLHHGERLLAEAPTSTPLAGGAMLNLSLGIVDRRVFVEIDDIQTLMFDLDSTSPAILPADISPALGCRNLDAEVTLPTIFRDIHYLNPHHRPDDWEMEQPLGEDEFFLLGDNPANSRDSRHYGAVQRSAILGSVEVREK